MTNETIAKVLGEHPELLQPYGNYLLVRILNQREAESTLGGIFLPEAAREKKDQVLARCIAAGPGQRSAGDGSYIPTQTEPGDLVLVLKNRPYEIKVGDATLYVVFEGDVIGRIDEARMESLLAEQSPAAPAEPHVEETLIGRVPAAGCPVGETPAEALAEEKGEILAETDSAIARVKQQGGLFIVTTEKK